MPAPQTNSPHPDVWFAQTLEAQQRQMMPPQEDKSFLPSVGLFALPALICVTLLVVARPNGAQSQTPGAKSNIPAKAVAANRNAAGARLVVAQHTETTTSNGPTVEPSADGTERLPLSYYTGGIRGSMFGAPVPTPPKPAPKPVIKVDKPKPIEPVVLAQINPFADWSYTGTIKMGEETMALLENTKTKEGQYVRAGERFMGQEITKITEQEVTIGSGATPSRIAKSDSVTVTPLDRSAPFLGGGGQPGQPGAPGQPPGGMPAGMPTPPPGGQVIMPNGRVFNPADMERMRSEMLNRRFNGGGGRGRN